jgi:Tfp pilus assembly protein PilX
MIASAFLNSSIRLLLVLAAVTLLALAQQRSEAWQERYSASFANHQELPRRQISSRSALVA